MNESLRRVIAWLPWVTPLLLLGALWLYLQNSAEQVRWAPYSVVPTPAPAAPAAPATRPVVDLYTYSAVWETPLFAPGRRADSTAQNEAASPPPGVDDLLLTGIMIAPPLRVALLTHNGDQTLKLKERDVLPNGWTLARIVERRVELTFDNHRHTLEISSPRLPMPLQ